MAKDDEAENYGRLGPYAGTGRMPVAHPPRVTHFPAAVIGIFR
jgi:hypothetical protein